MSYHRSDAILTLHCLEYCTYVVREEEAELYRQAGVTDLLVIPTGATLKDGTKIWSFMTTLWWIIENAPEDVFCILDDDISSFLYISRDTTKINVEMTNGKEIATSEIERIGQLIYDLDLGVACNTASADPKNFTAEFRFMCCPGAMRWINKRCLKAKFDPDDWATSDVDFNMQELLHNRILINPRYFTAMSVMNTNAGGTPLPTKVVKEYHLAMKNKWGRYIDFNEKRNIFMLNVKR